MTSETLLLLFVVTIGVPGSAVIAGGLGWWAFRAAAPRWLLIVVAAAILVAPFALLGAMSGGEGVAIGLFNPFVLPSAVVALVLGIASYRLRV